MNLKDIFNFIKFSNNSKYLLGRWCHLNVPNCNENVILKKIDFANSDNNLCINKFYNKKLDTKIVNKK